MFDRAEIIDKNFIDFVQNDKITNLESPSVSKDSSLKSSDLISLFESQVLSRHIDFKARSLKNDGKCFYTIGSSGHEGNAVFGKIFDINDIAFLHYRSTPFFIERSKQLPGSTPLYDLALSFVASSEDPISGGRHKVIGSKELNIPPQTSTIASHLPKAVGTAFSIDRAKDLNIQEKYLKNDSVVICSFGDASVNHATALSAFNTASLIKYNGGHVPIVFICEDNGIGISVPTHPNWIENQFSGKVGMKYIQTNGLDLIDLQLKTSQAVTYCRSNRHPVFLHMKTVRLMGHAGSDIETGYMSQEELISVERQDPLLFSAKILIDNKCLRPDDLISIYEYCRKRVDKVFEYASTRPKLIDANDIMFHIATSSRNKLKPKVQNETSRKKVFGKEYGRLEQKYHMAKLINYALHDILLQYSNTVVFGEDVGKKGGVYHVTADLHKKFGSRRVFDSPLDETSILGFSSGFSQNGFIPIPEIQFLAYFHNAEDQIRGEAATLSFFSQGQFTSPMVVRIPGLAYQKGFGGHFHNDNSLSVFRDIPGIIVAVPSNGADAVRMLRSAVREAYEKNRIIIFIEPIALYMTKDLHTKGDEKWSFKYPEISEEIAVGEIKKYGNSKVLTILSYGNGLYLTLQAQKEIEKRIGNKIQIIDLRWLSEINEKKLLKTIGSCSKILIVDECRKSGSYGEGIVADLHNVSTVSLKIKLHAAKNSFIPIGEGATSTLPSKESIIEAAIELFNG
jgi:2-oxoisovalerate dehydrogenase E1 component